MNTIIQNLNKEIVKVEISGKKFHKGTLIDLSSDVIVLFNGENYIYILFEHIQNLTIDNEEEIKGPSDSPSILLKQNKKDLTLSSILSQAQGMHIEICVTNTPPLHGTILTIQDDYFVFHSPIFKTMFIALKHLKWLIPYSQDERPYGLSANEFEVKPIKDTLSRTLEAQIEKMKNELVIFNHGEKSQYLGKIKNVKGQIVEIQTASSNFSYLNLLHIKTVQKV